MTEEKTIGEVYDDRNALVLGLAATVQRLHDKLRAAGQGAAMEYRTCWTEDDGLDADADEWAIVYCWLPTGQVSWHVPREMVEQTDIPKKSAEWDGHDRAEKNQRLRSLAGGD
ncbi:ORF 11 [Haloarcula hispanica virus SH1]|uniref:ORF 11 n=1 Tax=Haloarcula hispanica SH1 virus TaxID=326574 RepID=Q4KPH6_9VIRU|nr:ORF 11 [Haloarcula hispanica virus SH1]AAY24937.1 ORF 11 [Haloarcula hispanica virus SH1]